MRVTQFLGFQASAHQSSKHKKTLKTSPEVLRAKSKDTVQLECSLSMDLESQG